MKSYGPLALPGSVCGSKTALSVADRCAIAASLHPALRALDGDARHAVLEWMLNSADMHE